MQKFINALLSLSLSLSVMEKNESILTAVLYFWSNSANAFIFGHGPMIITLADIFVLTGLNVTGSVNPHDFLGKGCKSLGKISDLNTWPVYIKEFSKTTTSVDEKEHIAFLNMWLEKFFFCGTALGPTNSCRRQDSDGKITPWCLLQFDE